MHAICLSPETRLDAWALEARLSSRSRRPARGKTNALRNLLEMVVGESVPAQAQLPGQGPLAEPLAPGGSVLIESARVPQQGNRRSAYGDASRQVQSQAHA